ncbi:glycine-rich protein [Clostridioides sp. GD02404]|uniref:glycine rich domain-containing protein n=1 Tax=Clostridioides sp. GD02404 TaxID=3054354 RepID=UPI00389FC747
MTTVYEFNCTGSEQSVTLKPGKYKFECWGARGGTRGTPYESGFYYGYGGYCSGEITLKKETTLYLYVGLDGRKDYRFNGGGSGSSASGGGATDIRLIGGEWDNEQGLLSRIIVAGGGGGTIDTYRGGDGGGLKGMPGRGWNGIPSHGGTQFEGGKGITDDGKSDGFFGNGATYKNPSIYSGGGGGWFGGSATSGSGSGSGGGSGYVLTKDSYKPPSYIPTSEYYFDNVVMTTGGNTTVVGDYSDGRAKITLLQALPFLTVSSYNSTQATFKADHTDPTLLTKIEYFIDDVLKETITTDLTTEKIINYTLEDNALHTLKIVVTDSANATAEKVVSISKNIMPLGDDASLQDIATKVSEMKDGLINGKNSIINVLALKNIESSLNNSLVELSEKVKESFDSSDTSVQELQNQLTEKNNTISQLNTELGQRKRWATGTYTFTQNDVDNFYSEYYYLGGKSKSLVIPTNLGFTPSLIVINYLALYGGGYTQKFYAVNNLNTKTSLGRVDRSSDYYMSAFLYLKDVSSSSFTLYTYRADNFDESKTIYYCKVGDTFTWYAYE